MVVKLKMISAAESSLWTMLIYLPVCRSHLRPRYLTARLQSGESRVAVQSHLLNIHLERRKADTGLARGPRRLVWGVCLIKFERDSKQG